uniref:NADH-ubiquinone oxidoreductase chain 5 n=1 Tax=Whitmania laevis TaxID=307844 RepID=A0A0F6PBN9_WHILA|nr:NADH dehydrogenase subunit 5 [Whitmania laevis]
MMFHKYVPMLLMTMSLMMMLCSMVLFYMDSLLLIEFELIAMKDVCISIPLLFDMKGVLFSSIVLFISSNVMMFSMSYMEMDKDIDRFSIFVFLFILSMNLLIFIPNLAFLLIGWDGLGITSFILVIYYLNSKSLGAGMITAITNRIGDVLLLISIALCIGQCHWYAMDMWFYDLYENKVQVMLILGAGMTKSAQVPFSSWLPAAMAAPTPVSALVHSSTLVTAGVFLLIRFYDFLYCFDYFNVFLLSTSIITMVMSGLAASVEWDMKKIIALSTLSQLGLMMMTLSLNMLDLAYLHMVSHALFKALLFICAGNLIMNFFHSQDLRWMGNLSMQMPLTSSSILLSSMAMSGFPFLSSFYTKDQILELLIYNSWSMSVVALMYLSIGITVFYSVRFCINLLWMVPMHCVLVSLNENKNVMTPMFIMSLMTVCVSGILLWIYPNFYSLVHIDKLVMLMPLFIIFIGFYIALVYSITSTNVEFKTQLMNNYMWFMVPLSTQVILNLLPNTKLCLELLDQSWLEYLGGYGMYWILNYMYMCFVKYMNWELMWMMVKMGLLMPVMFFVVYS